MVKNFFKYIWEKWKKIAYKIGWFNSIIIFSLIYFVVLGIYASISFLIRFIKRMFHKELSLKTFWRPKTRQLDSLEEMRKQF